MNLANPSKEELRQLLCSCCQPDTCYRLSVTDSGEVLIEKVEEGDAEQDSPRTGVRFHTSAKPLSPGVFFGQRAAEHTEYLDALIERLIDNWNSGFCGTVALPVIDNYGWTRSETTLLDYITKGPESLHGLLTRWCALSKDILEKYERCFSFRGMSGNRRLEWSADLITKHSGQWDWTVLSGNVGIPWSDELIERFQSRWDWGRLSANPALPWSDALIARYAPRWDWSTLSCNQAIPWSETVIDRHIDKLQWRWSSLCKNPAVEWNVWLIDKYSRHLLEQKGSFWNLSANPNVRWSHDLIDRYSKHWDWSKLGGNSGVPWSLDLIDTYQRYLFADEQDWLDEWCHWHRDEPTQEPPQQGISGNINVPWSEELIARYADRWNWGKCGLSQNPALPWSESLLDRYRDKWIWGRCGLSLNHKLPWSERLIHKHAGRWCWGANGLSSNIGIPWSEDLLASFNFWDTTALARNPAVPWTDRLVGRHLKMWHKTVWPAETWLHPRFPWSLRCLDVLEHANVQWGQQDADLDEATVKRIEREDILFADHREISRVRARARERVIMPLMSKEVIVAAITRTEEELAWLWSDEADEERRLCAEIADEQYWAQKEDDYLSSDRGIMETVFEGDANAFWHWRE